MIERLLKLLIGAYFTAVGTWLVFVLVVLAVKSVIAVYSLF